MGVTENFGDKREMALRAGLLAISTKLETGSRRLWFTSVNGYGSCEREKSVGSRAYGVGRNDDNYVSEKRSKHYSSTAPFQTKRLRCSLSITQLLIEDLVEDIEGTEMNAGERIT